MDIVLSKNGVKWCVFKISNVQTKLKYTQWNQYLKFTFYVKGNKKEIKL